MQLPFIAKNKNLREIKMLKTKASLYNLWEVRGNISYLVNTLTKGIVSFSSQEEVEFAKSILDGEDKYVNLKKYNDYCKILLDNGFLIDNQLNEVEVLRERYYASYNSEESLQITLLPTFLCNFGCVYCFEDKNSLRWSPDLVETLKKYSRINFEHKKQIAIALFGGEPTLEWNMLRNYLDYVIELRNLYSFELDLRMTTNAFLIDNDIAYDLVCKYEFMSLQITVDCNRENHNRTRPLKSGGGTYDKIVSNIKDIIALNIKYSKNLRIVLSAKSC